MTYRVYYSMTKIIRSPYRLFCSGRSGSGVGQKFDKTENEHMFEKAHQTFEKIMNNEQSLINFYLKSKAKDMDDKEMKDAIRNNPIKREVRLRESMTKRGHDSLFFNTKENMEEKLKNRNHLDYLNECEEVTRLQSGGKEVFKSEEAREAYFGFNYRLKMKEKHGEQFYDGTDLSPKEFHIKFRNYQELSEVLDYQFERNWYNRMKSMSYHKRNEPNDEPLSISKLKELFPDLKTMIHQKIENQFSDSEIFNENEPFGIKDITRSEVLTKIYLLNSTKDSLSAEERENLEDLNKSLKIIAGIDLKTLNKKFGQIEKLISDLRNQANLPQKKLSLTESQQLETDIKYLMFNSISSRDVLIKYFCDPIVYKYENIREFSDEIYDIQQETIKIKNKKKYANKLDMTLEELDELNEINNKNMFTKNDNPETGDEKTKEED